MMAWALLAAGLAGTGPLTSVSISANVTEGGGIPELVAALEEIKALGVKETHRDLVWEELAEGKVAEEVQNSSNLRGLGFDLSVLLKTIDTNVRRTPQDVEDLAWNDPVLLEKWSRFLEGFVREHPPMTRISLGNEVDVYLRENPDEIDGFLRFLEVGREAVRKASPKMNVGVTTTFEGLTADPELHARLHEGMDFVAITYYPHASFAEWETDFVQRDFDTMLDLAKHRPLVLQEIGYPASTAMNSSETKQARFFRAAFQQINDHAGRIDFANIFILSDFTSEQMELFTAYYGSEDPDFVAFLGSLGLKDRQGNPRQAWSDFVAWMKG